MQNLVQANYFLLVSDSTLSIKFVCQKFALIKKGEHMSSSPSFLTMPFFTSLPLKFCRLRTSCRKPCPNPQRLLDFGLGLLLLKPQRDHYQVLCVDFFDLFDQYFLKSCLAGTLPPPSMASSSLDNLLSMS